MRQRKLNPIVVPCLFFLLFATMASCTQPPATVIEQPASQRPAEFEVGPITFEPPVVMVGDTVTVAATVNNKGDLAGIYTAVLLVDGQETGKKDIPINPGSSQEVNFQLSKTAAGSYNLAIGDSSTVLTANNWSPYTIQYDESDGVLVCIYVSGENGHIVRFTPPNKAFKIQKIRVLGSVKILNTSEFDKNHVTVRIWDKEGNNQLWSKDVPWRLFMGPAIWREIKVPDVRVNDDFYVEVVTHSNPSSYKPGTEIRSPGGDPIGFVDLQAGGPMAGAPIPGGTGSVVVIGFDYPQSYIDAPSKHAETRSGYSYMGKLIDPGQGRLQGINWLIRVDGEGAAGD
ncbi:MAG: hypothetical protein MUO89_04655 [Dehalococcoidia bacterium]|nr:hypothetical protein [Dehalococcoidia bacterium]